MLAASDLNSLSPERRLGSRNPAIPHIYRILGLVRVIIETRHCPTRLVKTARRSRLRGELDAGKVDSFKLESETYDFDVEPGKVYGFIADAESGVPIGINVKNKATSKFMRDAKDPRQTSELELAPTAWITVTEPTTLEVIVWSLVAQPAKYELFAYEWPAPKPAPSSDAES